MGELMLLRVYFVGEPLLQLLPICMVVTLTLGELTKQMMVLFLVLLQLVKFVVWFKIMSFYAPYVWCLLANILLVEMQISDSFHILSEMIFCSPRFANCVFTALFKKENYAVKRSLLNVYASDEPA